ncbi:MAG: hypothetical protein PHC69_09425 [Ruminiclostridium sp.]|nr:hypothetical protein [Ruminiclostridium sp.]
MSNFSLDQNLSPEWHAKCLIQKLNIKKLPIIAKDIAEQLAIRYVEEDLDNKKVDGALYRKNGKALTLLSYR